MSRAPPTRRGPRARTVALAALALVALTAVLALVTLARPRTTPACAFAKPVLCAELPPDGATLAKTLSPAFNPPHTWRLAMRLDMRLLVAYGALSALGIAAVAARTPAGWRGSSPGSRCSRPAATRSRTPRSCWPSAGSRPHAP